MQVLLVVVLFILLFSMVPLFDLSASFSIVFLFQSSSMPSSTISSSGVKFPQWVGCTVIRQKKNNLLYKDITCLYHSHAQLWVLCLVVLFMLVLRLAPLCVGPLLCGSVCVRTTFCSFICSVFFFFSFVHAAVVFDGSLLFSIWRGCFIC